MTSRTHCFVDDICDLRMNSRRNRVGLVLDIEFDDHLFRQAGTDSMDSKVYTINGANHEYSTYPLFRPIASPPWQLHCNAFAKSIKGHDTYMASRK